MIQKLTDLVIKPHRSTYDPKVDLGPTVFSIDNTYLGKRFDFEVVNRRKQTLKCSLFHRNIEKDQKTPLILYCHGNTGNRTSSYGAVYAMLKIQVSVITFDFAGCGLSDGETISLGYYEQNDIADILNHALKNFNFVDTNRIGIWGRCMGAVSSILFSAENPIVSLLILDSPFPDFPSLLRDYIQRIKIIPKWAEDYIYDNLRAKIKEQGNFDFEEVTPIKKVPKIKVPAFFLHGNQDGIIPIHHFKKVYEAYAGPKEYLELNTSHNDGRPDHAYDAINAFIKAKLFKPYVNTQFEPFSKQSKPQNNPVILPGINLKTLGSIRFNDNPGRNHGDEGMDPVKELFESFKHEKSPELFVFTSQKKETTSKLAPGHPKREFNKSLSFAVSEDLQESLNLTTTARDPEHPLLDRRMSFNCKNGLLPLFDVRRTQTEDTREDIEHDISEEPTPCEELHRKDFLEMTPSERIAKMKVNSSRKSLRGFISRFSHK